MNKGEVPLKLGYVGIRNRSQADINEKKTVFLYLISGTAITWRLKNVFFKKSSLFISFTKPFGYIIFGLKNDESIGGLYCKLFANFIVKD